MLAGLLVIVKTSLELAWISFTVSQYAIYEHQFTIDSAVNLSLWLFFSLRILDSVFIQEFQLHVAKAWRTTPRYWQIFFIQKQMEAACITFPVLFPFMR